MAVTEHILSLGFLLWVVEAQKPSLCVGCLLFLGGSPGLSLSLLKQAALDTPAHDFL